MTSSATGAEDAAQRIQALPDREFEHALRTVAPHLRAFARALCGSVDRADDLAQETMLKAWAARHLYQAGTNFKAWTFTILRNQFYSEARRDRFRGDYVEGMADRVLHSPASQEHAVELGDVLRALSMIPARYREALILVSVGSLAYEEVAAICDVAVGTIKSRVSRARAMLSQTIASGQMVDFRHNFVLGGEAIDAFFDELLRIGNMNGDMVEEAA